MARLTDPMTVRDAAAVLGVTGSAIQWRIDKGYMRAERDKWGRYLIPRAEVERWMQLGRLPRAKRWQRPAEWD